MLADRYVEQLRIGLKSVTIEYLFRAQAENAGVELMQQRLSVEEALWAFVEDKQERYKLELQRLMSGDGSGYAPAN